MNILWICSFVLVINAAQCYVLLTATLDDVQTFAKQVLNSPVADQLKKIWRRASNQFHTHLDRSRIHKRAEDDLEEDVDEKLPIIDEDKQDREFGIEDQSTEILVKRRRGEVVAATEKNASYYNSSVSIEKDN